MMGAFSDLESLYSHLEDHVLEYKYLHQIGNEFQKVRDIKREANEQREAEKAQWELDVFTFNIKGNELKPMYTFPGENGQIAEYPSLAQFDERTYEYLDRRLGRTANPLLKARYAHLLWFSPERHAKYAKAAIDAYLELVPVYIEHDRQSPTEHHGLDVRDSIVNAFSLSCHVNHRTQEIKLEIKRLIVSFSPVSASSKVRADLINLILSQRRIFTKEDLDGFQEVCWDTSLSLSNSGDHHSAIGMLEIGEKIDQRTGRSSFGWRLEIAKLFENLMIEAEKTHNLAFLSFCQDAIVSYRRAKNAPKVEELERKYVELKGKVKFGQIDTKLDLTDHLKWCGKIAERIAQLSPEQIMALLIRDKSLLPTYENLKKTAREHGEKYVLSHIFAVSVLDHTGHPAQHFSSDDEKLYHKILEQFGFELRFDKIHLIHAIFTTLIKENRLSSAIMVEFLRQNSWLGRTLSKPVHSGHTMEYNWLSLIAPAIYEFFLQMQFWIMSGSGYLNMVLCIDSLSVKMEGLVRDMCQMSGATTCFMTQDSQGRNIVREKDIHTLLYEKVLAELFDKDDLLFFRYLLVEQAGCNLRHRVAHSLLTLRDYSVDYMYLLLLAVLRLGKYDFSVKPSNEVV